MIRELIDIGGTSSADKDFARPFHIFLALAILNGVCQGAALGTMVPVLMSVLQGDMHQAHIWLCVFAAATLVSIIVSVVANGRAFDSSMIIIESMHRRLGQKLINLPLGWFNADATGRASHLAVKGTMFVASAAMDVLVPYIGNIVSPLTLIIVSLIFDWRLGLCLLVGAPLIYGSAKLAMWLNNRADVHVHSAQINTDTRLLEFGRAQVSLRAAGLTGSDYQPLAEAIERQRKAGRGALWASVISMILQNIVVQLLFAAVVSLAVYLAMGGADPVLMLALIGLLTQFVKPLQVIAEVGTTLRTTDHELEDITEILNLDPMPEPDPEAATALPAAPADYDIAVQDVHFRYRPDLPEILRGASFQLPAGSMTALVGASGSGKTTITRLIARFWDVTSGSITIDGKDIRSYTTADLMSMLSLVFQDIYLFDDTLEANIAYGNPQASAADIRAAAERAGVTEIAQRLPDGWESRVGEGGRLLSGGERQRVSIARALLKQAPIVLFDEATASLDASMEKTVQESIAELAQTSTVLVIAHQLSTVQNADNIVVLDDGVVAEQGTHSQLMALGGRYSEFWRRRDAAHGWVLTASSVTGFDASAERSASLTT